MSPSLGALRDTMQGRGDGGEGTIKPHCFTKWKQGFGEGPGFGTEGEAGAKQSPKDDSKGWGLESVVPLVLSRQGGMRTSSWPMPDRANTCREGDSPTLGSSSALPRSCLGGKRGPGGRLHHSVPPPHHWGPVRLECWDPGSRHRGGCAGHRGCSSPMRSRRSIATVSKALRIMGYSSSTSLKLSTDRE